MIFKFKGFKGILGVYATQSQWRFMHKFTGFPLTLTVGRKSH